MPGPRGPSSFERNPKSRPSRRPLQQLPVLGGRSKNDQLGSVAESWGPLVGTERVYGMFQIEADAPSRSTSPFEDESLDLSPLSRPGTRRTENLQGQEARAPTRLDILTAKLEALKLARAGTTHERLSYAVREHQHHSDRQHQHGSEPSNHSRETFPDARARAVLQTQYAAYATKASAPSGPGGDTVLSATPPLNSPLRPSFSAGSVQVVDSHSLFGTIGRNMSSPAVHEAEGEEGTMVSGSTFSTPSDAFSGNLRMRYDEIRNQMRTASANKTIVVGAGHNGGMQVARDKMPVNDAGLWESMRAIEKIKSEA